MAQTHETLTLEQIDAKIAAAERLAAKWRKREDAAARWRNRMENRLADLHARRYALIPAFPRPLRGDAMLYDEMSATVAMAIFDAGLGERHVICSTYETIHHGPDGHIVHFDIDAELTPRPVRFMYGGGWGKAYIGADIIERPTWRDALIHAERAIRHSGDTHHAFLENVRFVFNAADEPGEAHLEFGS